MAITSTTPLSHVSVAETILNEIVSGRDSYYYFYGKTIPFSGGSQPEEVIDDILYENEVKRNIVLMKKINASDVAHCVSRIDWVSGDVYDIYDDSYHGAQLTSISVTSEGTGYSNSPIVVIEESPEGVTAKAVANVSNGAIASITIIDHGTGYTSVPSVSIVDPTGTGASVTASIGSLNLSYNGYGTLPMAKFYVITSEFKVYKCLCNNENSPSTVMPTGTYADQFTTSDGYVWKFMFYLPESVRRKWMIPTYFPVTKELTNNIHPDGGVDMVSIITHGSGYSRGTSTRAYMIGDGTGCVLSPIVSNTTTEIVQVNVDASGIGYKPITNKTIKSITRTSNVVTVITTNAHNLIPGISVTIAGDSTFNGSFYVATVIDPNTFTYNETKADGIKDFGELTFTNTTKTIASINRTDNVVTVVTTSAHNLQQYNAITISGTTNFNGKYKIESIVNTTTFKFSKNGLDGFNETSGTITFNSIDFTSISLTSNVVTVECSDVHNFIVGDSVTIATGDATFDGTFTIASVPNYKTFTYAKTGTNTTVTSITLSYATSVQVIGAGSGKYSGITAILEPRIYQTTGYNYVTAPNVTITPTNGGINGAATATISSGKIDNIIVDNIGSGYVSEPTISFSSGNASAHAIVHNGTIVAIETNYIVDGISIIDPGVGYSDDSDISITVTGDGTGAKILPVVNSSGEIISTIIENPGSGYTYANLNIVSTLGTGGYLTATANAGRPDTLQYLIESQAINGAISVIKVSSGGSNYTTATVTIAGDGTGATATATITNGAISKINVTNSGQNYSIATITITGDGTGATARAILPPCGGHGKDAVKELYANKLIFFSNLSNNDLVESTMLTNGYRQYGIVKNPTAYGSPLLYSGHIGTTCFIVEGTFTVSDFIQDEIVTITKNSVTHEFLVVEVVTGKIFLIPLGWYVPEIGDELVKQSDISKHFTLTSVINPNINKFSGELFYINNSSEFSQSEAQVIKSRTILQF